MLIINKPNPKAKDFMDLVGKLDPGLGRRKRKTHMAWEERKKGKKYLIIEYIVGQSTKAIWVKLRSFISCIHPISGQSVWTMICERKKDLASQT